MVVPMPVERRIGGAGGVDPGVGVAQGAASESRAVVGGAAVLEPDRSACAARMASATVATARCEAISPA